MFVVYSFVNLTIEGDLLIIRVKLPQVGQYGLDIYAKPHESAAVMTKGVLAHVCKYLLNCSHVAQPVELLSTSNGVKSIGSPTTTVPGAVALTLGPLPAYDELGLKAVTHPETQTIRKPDKSGGVVYIEFLHPETIKLAGRLTLLPGGEDASNRLAEKTKGKKTKFTVTIPKDGGAYTMEIFAVKDDQMVNVYNYAIDFSKDKKK